MSYPITSSSYKALVVIRTVLTRAQRAIHTQIPTTPPNLLKPTTPTDHLGLPLAPLPTPIPHIEKRSIDREALLRLHRLSALNPPEPGSEDETILRSELGELVGLMDLVREVELPSGDRDEVVRELLSQGVGEVVIDGSEDELEANEADGLSGREGKNTRELLDYATRRAGDYYAHKLERGKMV